MQGNDLFENDYMSDADGNYDAHAHLAQMISYLGPPPKELVEEERKSRSMEISPGGYVINTRGEQCKTVCEYWEGPSSITMVSIFSASMPYILKPES